MLEVREGSSWADKTRRLSHFKHSVTSREIEKIEFELVGDDVSVGQRCRYWAGGALRFEGVVHSVRRRHAGGDVRRTLCEAFSDLILYDRHVVFREYQAGTRAGSIIKDLASLEDGVDLSNVDEEGTPELLSPWPIENVEALRVMLNVARGVNYYIRMKPGRRLYFKPKNAGRPVRVIDGGRVISADYCEDRWRLRNRVIYVGPRGEVLADVREGEGDLPVVVHDPFLADRAEARRRAEVRLALGKEYGRQLRVLVSREDFDSEVVDLYDLVRVDLPSIGLNGVEMHVVEIQYSPGDPFYELTLGGRLELLEDYLHEAVGGDAASRFGGRMSIAEVVAGTSTLVNTLQATVKIQARAVTVRAVNRPPMVFDSGENIVLDSDGNVVLASGFTWGRFEWGFMPESETFTRWLRAVYSHDPGGGSVTVNLKRGAEVMASGIPPVYDIPYLPRACGEVDEHNASRWGVVGGTVSDSGMGVVSHGSVAVRKTAGTVEAYYPSARNLDWPIGFAKYFSVYLYSPVSGSVEVRLHRDHENYYSATLQLAAGAWRRYEVAIASMSRRGHPGDRVNWISFISALPSFNIDTDYVLIPAKREKLTLEFNLSRPSPLSASPKIMMAALVWREGG